MSDTKALQEELEQFKKEKENIRNVLGQIGGAQSRKRDIFINVFFFVLILALFFLDIYCHFCHVQRPLPPMSSLGLGILLISIKIIWMMHKQTKVEHFQFWILNSIEFRVNKIMKKVSSIEESLKRK